MTNPLLPMPSGNNKPARISRATLAEGRKVFGDIQLAALKVDGAAALCGHIMSRAEQVDLERRSISRGDPVLDSILVEIEATFIAQCKAIQRSVHSPWGLT